MVMTVNTARIAMGWPRVSLAERMAMYSKRPELFTTATNSIIPTSTPMVLRSTYSAAVSTVSTWVSSSTTAPARAATLRWTFSEMMAAITSKKTPTAIVCSIFMFLHFLHRRSF